VYTPRSLLLSAIGVPFYYLALAVSVSPIVMVALFVNPLLIALTSLVIFCFSTDLYGSTKIGLVLSLIFNVCSFVLSFTSTYWAQPLQALTIVTAIFFIHRAIHCTPFFICNYFADSKLLKKSKTTLTTTTKSTNGSWHHNSSHGNRRQTNAHYFAAFGGLFLGLSVFAHASSIVFVPGFLAYSFFEMRKRNINSFFSFLALLSIVLICMTALNYLRYNSITEFGYGHNASINDHNGWKGLIGLLVSPGAGLFLYFPVSILLPWAVTNMKKQKKENLMYLFLFIIIITWISFGTLSFNFEPFSWWGTGWGPRYFVVVLPLVTLMIGSLLVGIDKKKLTKYSIIILCLSGLYINIIGILYWSFYDEIYLIRKEKISGDKLWNILIWQPSHSPIVIHTKALLEDFSAHIPIQRYKYTSWHWATYGLVPCSYDNYIYCKGGVAATGVVLAVIAYFAADILVEMGVFDPRLITRLYSRRYYESKFKKLK
jgi:hypothetical protein